MRRLWSLMRFAALFTVCVMLMGVVPTYAQQATDIKIVSTSTEVENNHWITFTAFLTCGDALPTGKVTFSVDKVQVVQADIADGVAQFGITFTTGDHEITADYAGDSACGAGHGVMDQLVVAVANLTTQSSLDPSVVGQAVTFTALVHCQAHPTGFVDFFIDGSPVGTVPVAPTGPDDGTAQFTTSNLSAGTHEIDTEFNNSFCLMAGTVTQFVGTNTVTWCNLGSDGRLNSQCGDRIAVYCNNKVNPANIDIWVVDNSSVGHDLTTIPVALLTSVPMGQFVKGLGNNGVIFAGLDADGNGYAALQGGPYGGTAKGDWSKTFVCKNS